MTWIAASGTVIAAAALFIVLSGFGGLKDLSVEFSSFIDPDLKVLPAQGKSFELTENETKALQQLEGVSAYSTCIEERAILEFNDKRQVVTLKGVDGNYTNVTAIDSLVIYGRWLEHGLSQMVAGGGVSHNLSFGVLDVTNTLMVYVPRPGKGQITSIRGAFNAQETVNVGLLNSLNEDVNNNYVFSDIEMARDLLNYGPSELSSIEFKLEDASNESAVVEQLNTIFGNRVDIKNKAQQNDALYKMLNTENVAVYLIFTLVIIIALFNVVGALIMMILDKKESINTLFNMGATTKDIRRIFFLQGSLMTISGGLAGLFLGFILVMLQQQFEMVYITASIPYPVSLTLVNFLVVIATVVVLGILASKVASGRITKELVKG